MLLFVDGQWESVVVDDFLPLFGKGTDDDQNQGLAQSTGTWVSLLEKAVAKYYGSYEAIESGYVHHGLELLMGSTSECLYLASTSTEALWCKMQKYKACEFVLGAGALALERSRTVRDSGLTSGTYAILDLKKVDGLRLLFLRAPGEAKYKGHWTKEENWTPRLRHKLGASKGGFWMGFEEFCKSFRCLYVCHSQAGSDWITQSRSGAWVKGSTELEATDLEDTAAGLPSYSHPTCEVERNPQFTISTSRPTTLRIELMQQDQMGQANPTTLPVAMFLVSGRLENGTMERYRPSRRPSCFRQ